MLSLFKKHAKREDTKQAQDDISTKSNSTHIVDTHFDEASLKRSIEIKLKGYRPLEREANFSRPNIYN